MVFNMALSKPTLNEDLGKTYSDNPKGNSNHESDSHKEGQEILSCHNKGLQKASRKHLVINQA